MVKFLALKASFSGSDGEIGLLDMSLGELSREFPSSSFGLAQQHQTSRGAIQSMK
jgi:hypothetical protein